MDLGNFELRHLEANDFKTDFVSNEEDLSLTTDTEVISPRYT